MSSPWMRMRSPALVVILVALVSFSARAVEQEAPRPIPAAAAATGAEKPQSDASPDSDPAEADEDGFWGYVYALNDLYPIILDKNLEPEVDDKVILLWVTTIACGALCGPLWIPMLIVGEDPGMEYFAKEALLAILVEWLTYVVGGATTSVGGLGTIIITANLCYFAPVSLINTYDRALKRQRQTGGVLDDDIEKGSRTPARRNAPLAFADHETPAMAF